MFGRVIVGVDGGPGGRDALALARVLAAEEGGITLAHVPVRVDWRESRTVARRLHRLADESGSDLIVVGSSRRGVWGRALLGDGACATLHDAPCAVAVAPRGYALDEPVMHRLGVGYDGSGESEHALAVGRGLARRLGAKLTAFRAVPVSAESSPVNGSSGQLPPIPGLDSEIAYGEAPVELAFFSDAVDLLVVGTRGLGPIGRMLHGSTAGQLARSAGCPLLVVSGEVRATPRFSPARPAPDRAPGAGVVG